MDPKSFVQNVARNVIYWTWKEKSNKFLNNRENTQIEINWQTHFEKQVNLFSEVLFPM